MNSVGDGCSVRLELAASLESYIANPLGFFITGDNVAIFAAGNPREGVEGLSFWGRPGDADIDMVAATLGDSGVIAGSHALLVDLRRLDCIDLRVFSKLPSALAPQCKHSRQFADRYAVLRPEGFAGSMEPSYL